MSVTRDPREPNTPARDSRLVLASGSPRRSAFLEQLGLEFVVRPIGLDESVLEGEAPEPYVKRLAEAKATAELHVGELVLAADTIVVVDDTIVGKPRDRAHAIEMLATLAGRWHEVKTGVAVACREGDDVRCDVEVETTRVRFAAMTHSEREWYSTTGEPDDKAGSYAIQGIGGLFVDRLEGSYSNVVGLPLPNVRRLLFRHGHDVLSQSRIGRGSTSSR